MLMIMIHFILFCDFSEVTNRLMNSDVGTAIKILMTGAEAWKAMEFSAASAG